jgi:preprotein translocase subunit SecD
MVCFNLVLALAMASVSACSTASSDRQKPIETFRVHLESRHDIPERSMPAEIGEANPMRFTVEKLPILSEIHVEEAALLEQSDGFTVQVRFNGMGARILEGYSSAAIGRHFLIMTEIDEEVRWIAAPLIRHRNSEGTLTFTPQATREEMQRLVAGLNGAVEKRRKRWLDQ